MVQLDHISLLVNPLEEARRFLESRFGFRVTPTPGAREHGRIFLHRGYLEVSTPQPQPAGESLIGAWRAYFLGTKDAPSLARTLESLELRAADLAIYQGHDGQWYDLGIETAHPQVPPIIVVQRLTPPDVAADWPPPLAERHPNGAEVLLAARLILRDAAEVEALAGTLTALVGSVPAGSWRNNPFLGGREVIVPLPAYRWMAIGHPTGPGRAAGWLAEKGPGIFAAGFGVTDLGATRRFLSAHLPPSTLVESTGHEGRPQLWLLPHGQSGVYLFFE